MQEHHYQNKAKNVNGSKSRAALKGQVLMDNRPPRTTQLAANNNLTGSSVPIQFTLTERLKSGFGGTSVAAGAIVGLALYSNPVGWSVLAAGAGGLLASGAVSYLRGSDTTQAAPPIDATQGSSTKKAVIPAKPKIDKEADWRKSQEDREEYEDAVTKLSKRLVARTGNLRIDLRTVYRKLIDLEPLLEHVRTLKTTDLDTWRGKFTTEQLRTAFNRNKAAQESYSRFIELIEAFDDIAPYQHLTRKDFMRYSSLEAVVTGRRKDFEERRIAAERIEKSIGDVDHMLNTALMEGEEIKKLSKGVQVPLAAQPAHLTAPVHNTWFATTYPNGWVHLQGNAYAAITAAGAAAAPHGSLGMFQEALQNGTIADRGTGASGVKWAKNELKVRRTRLESIQVAGDTRLTGARRVVPVATTGLATPITVLEFTHAIQAH